MSFFINNAPAEGTCSILKEMEIEHSDSNGTVTSVIEKKSLR